MERGKKDCLYTVLLEVSCLNLCSFAALVRWLAGANKGGSAAMGMPLLMILCSIISLAFFVLSSSEDQSSLCSISVTLLRLRKSPITKRDARHCTASNFIMSLTLEMSKQILSALFKIYNCQSRFYQLYLNKVVLRPFFPHLPSCNDCECMTCVIM